MTLIENIPTGYKLPSPRFVVKWGSKGIGYKCITTVTFREAVEYLQTIIHGTCKSCDFYKLERCDDTMY